MSVRETLGYSRSSRFFGPQRLDELPANELAFALRLAIKECGGISSGGEHARFQGAYVLQNEPNSPAIPVVYVIQVDSDALARKVHQFVWNQNQTPFLIVESPSTVRLYPGFSFRDTDQALREVANGTAEVLKALSAFRAESIDDGSLWKQWAHAVNPSQRVDETLLRDLSSLDKRLQSKHGVDRSTSHGLIGRYVYLNYLRARGILSDKKLARWEVDPDHIFTKHATLKAFRKVNDELQDWLNGSVFSLGDEAVSQITAEQLKLVARIFDGDSPVGEDGIQLTLFSSYDFSHIPIETLSCVYEQFLHDAKENDGSSRGKTLGAYYTPLPLTDYVLSEMERRLPLLPGMTVLDPACGSGAFLVQCYRRLIEKQRRTEARELKATELRDLLTKHIFGIDRDDDACRVAELSLIMTLLDYIEPPDLEHTNFKLPTLRNQNIFEGDFFDVEGPAFDLLAGQKFDWIVGNPPWAEVKGIPAKDHEHYTAHQWMLAHKKTHPTSGNQLAEAFIWKAGDHLSASGACGLVILAMTWFKKEATPFRQRFFSEKRVWCLANFANLAYVLFAGRSERPASVVFFESERPSDDHVVLTFAPFAAEQVANRPEKANKRLNTWNIVVSGDELREIDQAEVLRGESLTWKLAMWGTPRDRKLIERATTRFAPLEAYAKSMGIIMHQGLALRKRQDQSREPLEEHQELVGNNRLQMGELRNASMLFTIPMSSLKEITADDCYVRKGRARLQIAVSRPPHVFVDVAFRFAIYSGDFFAIPHPQIGIAGAEGNASILKALSVYLSSDFARYHQFYSSTQWGIDESLIDLDSLRKLPVALSQLGSSEIREWAGFQQEICRVALEYESHRGQKSQNELRALIASLNDRVFALLGIRQSERWLVEDFVQHHMELNKGKVTKDVMRSPTPEERQEYLHALQECLDGFFSSDRGLRHQLEVLADRESAMLAVSLVKSKTSVAPVVIEADNPASRSLKIIRDRLRTQHSQWVYFDRNLKVYDPQQGVLYQFKPLQRLHWTRRQAVLDADDIIAETMTQGGVS